MPPIGIKPPSFSHLYFLEIYLLKLIKFDINASWDLLFIASKYSVSLWKYFIEEEYSTLPFAERWLHRELDMSEFSKKVGLRELMQKQCVKVFPELKEEQGKIVTQTETTLLLTEGKVIRLL